MEGALKPKTKRRVLFIQTSNNIPRGFDVTGSNVTFV